MAKLPSFSDLDQNAILVMMNTLTRDDVVSIVTCASLLDGYMRLALLESFRTSNTAEKILTPDRGALGSFAARSDLLYVMKLIDKQSFQDLQEIAQIRNMVAHSHLKVDFTDPALQEHCLALRWPESPDLPESLKSVRTHDTGQRSEDSRSRFLVSVMTLWTILRHLSNSAT